MQLEMIDPAFLLPNPWNSNHVAPEIEKRLEASIRKHGMFKPILVRETDAGYEILGGEHRADAARRLGIQVPIWNMGRITGQQAKEIGLLDNARYGHDDAQELAKLLSEIGSRDEIMEVLPFDLAELESLTNTVSINLDTIGFDEDETAPVEQPNVKIVKTHTMMRFKIPLGDETVVTSTIESLIKTHNLDDSDSLVNAGDALMLLIRQLANPKV